jgi:hypothetical protein
MAVIGEEAFEVDLVRAAFGELKADRLNETLGLLVLDFSAVNCVMHAAQVDEIERSSAENEHRLEIEGVLDGREVVDKTALVRKLELANSRELIVNRCGICEQVGIVLNAAAQADLLLRNF